MILKIRYIVMAVCVTTAALQGTTELHKAVQDGDIQKVQQCLEHSQDDIHAKDIIGNTPLHSAIDSGYENIVRLLLQYNADTNAKNNIGNTPLYRAATWGHKDTAELLLQHNADTNVINSNNATPLHLAAAKGHKDTVELFLQHNADTNAKGPYSITPLHQAAASGHKDTVELLLQYNTDINAENSNGVTPLAIMRTKNCYEDIISLLNAASNEDIAAVLQQADEDTVITYAQIALGQQWEQVHQYIINTYGGKKHIRQNIIEHAGALYTIGRCEHDTVKNLAYLNLSLEKAIEMARKNVAYRLSQGTSRNVSYDKTLLHRLRHLEITDPLYKQIQDGQLQQPYLSDIDIITSG